MSGRLSSKLPPKPITLQPGESRTVTIPPGGKIAIAIPNGTATVRNLGEKDKPQVPVTVKIIKATGATHEEVINITQ